MLRFSYTSVLPTAEYVGSVVITSGDFWSITLLNPLVTVVISCYIQTLPAAVA